MKSLTFAKKLSARVGTSDAEALVKLFSEFGFKAEDIEMGEFELKMFLSKIPDLDGFKSRLKYTSTAGRTFEVSIQDDKAVINLVRVNQSYLPGIGRLGNMCKATLKQMSERDDGIASKQQGITSPNSGR